jgi:holin-like protein
VVGLALLAAAITWRGVPAALHETAQGLLRNLSLLFVPAGVGIVVQAGAIAEYWLAIAVSLLVSTVATLAVTALVFRWAARRFGAGEP